MFIPARTSYARERPIVAEFQGSAANGANQASYTFSSQPLGAARGDRVAVIFAALAGAGFSDVTLGGSSMTVVRSSANGVNRLQLGYLPFPTGTSADVVITASGTANHAGCAIWTYTGGLLTPVVTDSESSAASPYSSTLAVAKGGCIFGCAMTSNGGSNRFSFTGVTEDFETDYGTGASGEDFGGGHLEYAEADAAVSIGVSYVSASNQLAGFMALE